MDFTISALESGVREDAELGFRDKGFYGSVL